MIFSGATGAWIYIGHSRLNPQADDDKRLCD